MSRATLGQAICLALGAFAACRCGGGNAVGPDVPLPPSGVTAGTPGPAVRTGAAAGRPVILYSDLESAPAGSYVTFWGRDFGDAAGRVEIGGVPVTRVVRWTSAQVELQLPRGARSGAVVVHTAFGASPPFSLRVHEGAQWFVALGGDDGADGSEAHPFATIAKGVSAIRPGDVLYIRGGTHLPPPNGSFRALVLLGDVPTGTLERPIAIVGYPGEEVVIGDNTTQKVFTLDHDQPFEYVTIAKLTLLPTCLGIETLMSRHVRIVANEIAGARVNCGDSQITVGGGFDVRILGNDLHDNGREKVSAIYLSGFGQSHDIEIAYNRVREQSGGRGIQIYGHLPGDSVTNVRIHSNEISQIDRDGIVIGASDADVLRVSDVRIYNNVITRAGRCVGWAVRLDNPLAENVQIAHNTLVDNGAGDRRCYESLGEPAAQIGIERARSVTIENNLLVARGRATLVQLLDPNAVTGCANNLYAGRGAPCPTDARPLSGQPAFVDARALDFRLRPGSPGVDAAGPSTVIIDATGVARPVGSAPDVGALEADSQRN